MRCYAISMNLSHQLCKLLVECYRVWLVLMQHSLLIVFAQQNVKRFHTWKQLSSLDNVINKSEVLSYLDKL